MSAAGVCAELVAPVANMLAAAVAAGRLVSTTAGIPTRVASGAGDARSPAGHRSRSRSRRSRVRGQTKVRATHLDRTAVIYVRQSTLAQVREHTESTMRQYALAEEATRLGWAADAVEVIDADLGVSGRSVEGRDGFKALVARVCLGEIGAVFGLEISRLARSSADLSRLLELARLTDTLVIDADGIYDLADFNDRLLLGLKGTMSEAELHLLAGRLQGAKRAAAERGELRTPLPVGYVYDDDRRGRDRPGRGGRRRGRRRVHRVHRDRVGLRGGRGVHRSPVPPPRLRRSVGRAGPVRPADPLPGVLGILSNPVYAGAYVFGRFRSRRTVRPDGSVRTVTLELPRDRVGGVHPRPPRGLHRLGHVPGQRVRLAANRTNAGARPPREGAALCQGIVFCGSLRTVDVHPLRRSAPVLRVRPLPRRPRRHPRLPLGARRHRG